MTEPNTTEAGRPQRGWEGRFLEDFKVGDVYQHRLGRTVTSTDNIWFTGITHNPNAIHFDSHYSSQTEFGRPLVNSAFTLALVTGLSVADISQNGINLGWDEVRMPNPLFEGETVYAQSEVLAVRESRSRPHMGIIQIKTIGYTESGKIVIEYKRSVMVYRRGHAPTVPQPSIRGR